MPWFSGCFPPHIWRGQENCMVFSGLMFSSELLQSSRASPCTQHFTWALSCHTNAVVSKKPFLSLCTHVYAHTHFTRFSTSVAWALEPQSLKHLCLQHHERVRVIWKIHLTASLLFKSLISLLKMRSISLIYFSAFENEILKNVTF